MVDNKAKFTVILPTHNRSDILPFAIESVLYQTEQNFELLIVGDGCTDNTSAVVQEYLKDERIKWFDLPKASGFGYANRNKVFKKAKGKYIAFAAHDDILFPDHLEVLGKTLDESPEIDIVMSRALWIGEDGIVIPCPYNINNSDIFDVFMNIGNGIAASCVMHRNEVYKKIGFWNDKLPSAADWDFWKRIISSKNSRNYEFLGIETVLHFKANWRSNSTQLTYKMDKVFSFFHKFDIQFPENLKVKMRKGKSEQEIFWSNIKENKNFLRNLRMNSQAFLDSFMQTFLPMSFDKIISIENEINKNKSEIEKLQNEIAMLSGSFFFRLRNKLLIIFPKNSMQYKLMKKIINIVR
ncbi:MAG TPA: glycosyltransferase family A protein [Candidatus Dojkabacteria bacterium]|jgi:glycosyltransferase involved in cell wall biosynthesis